MANVEIAAGLRADIMRKQMECKNTLTSKGSLYVGLGTHTTVSGVDIYNTDVLTAGINGYVLLADSAEINPLGLKWDQLDTWGIKDSAVTTAKINDSDVTTAKINDSAVTTAKIENTAVTNEKLAANAVTAVNIINGAVTNAKLESPWISIGGVTYGLGSIYPRISNSQLANSSTTLGSTTLILGETAPNLDMGSGNVTAAHFYTGSDRKLKKNIINYQYHDSILDIPVHEFDYKDNNSHAIGFIAQELREKYPELVNVNENGYLEIAETKLVYLLIEEVKKLRDQLNNRR